MFKTYAEIRDWLEKFIPQVYGKEELGLARIEELLKRLGNPENKFKSIHIAGTSGKGSTAFYTARLLQGVNKSKWKVKVGLHVSPHLVDIRERMTINGKLIGLTKFIELIELIRLIVEKIQEEKPELTPSYFEILVAASFKYFADEKVDWAVVEVGLGGRLDATNVLMPEVSVITNIGLDHTEILGDTIEKIAAEKAGIIKGVRSRMGRNGIEGIESIKGSPREAESPIVSRVGAGVPVVTAAKGKALEVIKKVAAKKRAKLIEIDRNVVEISRNVTPETAGLAITAVETVLGKKLELSVVKEAFNVGFPGRFEEIESGVILDGAHNPDKIRSLVNFIKETKVTKEPEESKVTLVVAFKIGKNWQEMIDLLMQNLPVKQVTATEFQAVTDTGKFAAVPCTEIAAYVKSKWKVKVKSIKNSQEAVWEGLKTRDPLRLRSEASQRPETSLVVITGSLYLIGEVRPIWKGLEF